MAFITLASGLLIGLIHQQFIKRHPIASRPPVIVPVVVPVLIPQTLAEQDEADDVSYPDNVGIRPSDIEYFIDEHPRANLDRLQVAKTPPALAAWSFNFNLGDLVCAEIRSLDCQRVDTELE